MRRLAALLACTPGLLLVWQCGGPKAPAGPSPAACTPTPGAVCFGRQNYVELNAGDLPIVISVPHGGATAPAAIPDRTGTTVTDSNTIELGRAIVQAFQTQTGRAPHLVLCHLRRTKLDANREILEAAQGNAEAIQAWSEYHGFVETAMTEVVRRFGRGFYVDLHGHGHAILRLELGYLLSNTTLDLANGQLDANGTGAQSSLRLALSTTPAPFSEILRGPTSLGGLLEPNVPAVPGPSTPSPGADPYFDGGYSTERHTARLPGVQIESHFSGVRDTAANRAAFAATLVDALRTFSRLHLQLSF
jgi:hypothetical protein